MTFCPVAESAASAMVTEAVPRTATRPVVWSSTVTVSVSGLLLEVSSA